MNVFAYELPNGSYEIRTADTNTLLTTCNSIIATQYCCEYNGWKLLGVVFIDPAWN